MQRRRVGSGWVCSGWRSRVTAAKGREQQGNKERSKQETEREIAELHRTKKKQRETGTIKKSSGKETHTIIYITKHTKAGAHAQGPTNIDTERKEAPHPPPTLEQRPH